METNKPSEISLDEYIYLTENLEVVPRGNNKTAADFILLRKNSVVKRLVNLVMQEELSPEERKYIKAYHLDNVNKSELARRNGVTRKYVDRVILCAEKKLYAFLKYPVLLRFSLICPPENIFEELKEQL